MNSNFDVTHKDVVLFKRQAHDFVIVYGKRIDMSDITVVNSPEGYKTYGQLSYDKRAYFGSGLHLSTSDKFIPVRYELVANYDKEDECDDLIAACALAWVNFVKVYDEYVLFEKDRASKAASESVRMMILVERLCEKLGVDTFIEEKEG